MSVIDTSDLIKSPLGGRKLIAVIYADVVGYSRLIGLDDMGTLERLRALRRTLIDPAVTEHGGRIVQTGGDSLLIAFDSIDGAVRCATKVQEQVPLHDGNQPPDRTIRFRIGINIGDAIPDGTDLHGDAINVAVRLQAECPPGSICISRTVRDHIRGRLDLTFDELGALSLKNIAHPVEAFVMRADVRQEPEPSLQVTPHLGVEPAVVAGASWKSRTSIAVLPFVEYGASSANSLIGDGLAEDVIAVLASLPELFVISRTSTLKEPLNKSVSTRLRDDL